ncbi:hypothetical protein GOP47_0004754 [Adiantum capillus-veneris]|uniref:Uncharacterized protein n=1 Tax=Adiantum capillus-veneris TaxID=13818 RepID=A0A9D4V3V1_ADICA|nr:hypothetical protein GOP47_0004754 [Adiantum capillus-veneris]
MPRKATRESAPPQPSTTSAVCVSVGDCNVSIPHSLSHERSGNAVSIEVPNHGRVTITHEINSAEARMVSISNSEKTSISKKQGLPSLLEGLSVQLLNPKSFDSQGHLLLKAVLKLYSTELPEMSFAANTGKESPFLDKCVSSGKYCTLLLRHAACLKDDVVAAVSYQILPPDTQYAEIPLAAVSKDYQHKGIGSFLFTELQRRLQDVGVLTVFCWGDQESEGFWIQQGFLKVAEVDRLGKPRKLPIKPDIRRAMSIPGSAMLLVLHMDKKAAIVVSDTDNKAAVTPPRLVQPDTAEGFHESAPPPCLGPSPVALITTPMVGESRAPVKATQLPASDGQVKSSTIVPSNMEGAFSSVATQKELISSMTTSRNAAHIDVPMEPMLSLTFAPPQPAAMPGDDLDSMELVMPNQEGKPGANHSQSSFVFNKENVYSRSNQRGRKPETPQVQRTKKQKNEQGSSQMCERQLDFAPQPQRSPMQDLSSMNVTPLKAHLPGTCSEMVKEMKQNLGAYAKFEQQLCPAIMLMNMADDNRRMQLTKFVERLGGRVTNDGSQCTHVVTGEARRTLNFCNALNAGAWVVSPAWLKASVKEKRFVEEGAFILKDAVFESRYKTTLQDVITQRRQMPHGLLEGMYIYPTKHVQPPVETMSAIVLSAGGKVLASFEEAKQCVDAIVVACEDDISEALIAAKEGLPTYSSEWLMSCIMKQELDMTTTQFAESL